MAVPSPPPPPPVGDSILGDSITPSQSGSSLRSMNSTDINTESNREDKPWKRPSTLEEVRQSAGSWSLAGDAGLLLYLKKFSQSMLLRTHELEKAVDDLVHDTKGMDSKLHNTFNDFLMLSNKQFIENRVYDEEISQEESQEKDAAQQPAKTREQLESEILPRYSEAVNLGFQVLDDAFITVEIKAADESDDDEGLPSGYVPDPIIEPKDMYATRPLPYLIGTAEFFSDENLGLIEIDDEEEENKKNAKLNDEGETSKSEDESESESESESSEFSESSEDELPKKTIKKEVSDESESEEESESDEELFGDSKKKPESSEESESESEEVSKPKPKLDIQAELAAKLGIKEQVKVEENDDEDTKSITSKTSKTSKTTIDNESIKDESMTSSASKSKKEKKHRSRTKSSDEHKHHHHHHGKKKASDTGGSAVKTQEEESDEDLFGESKQKNSFEDDGLFGKKGGLFSGGGTLFDQDHQQEEGDLFCDNDESVKVDVTEEKQEEPATPTEIKPRTRTTSSGKKIPAGAVSLFGDSTPLFGGAPSFSKEPTIKEETVTSKKNQAKKPPPPVKGLFDDDEDELFAEKPKSNLLQEPPKQRRKKTLELFDDEEDNSLPDKAQTSQNKSTPSNAKTENAKTDKKVTLGDSGSLFEADNKTQAKPEPAIKKSTSKPKVVSLFGDDGGDEEDWFDSMNTTKTNTKETQKASTTAPAVSKKEENDSLFNEPKKSTNNVTTKKKEEPKKPSKSKKVVSLFDDDEEDLFTAPSLDTKENKPKDETKATEKSKDLVAKPKEKKHEKKHPKTKSFIDDSGNGLFGDDQEDLFSTPEKVTTKKDDKKVDKKPQPKSAISFLDGEDDNDDDFFSVPKKDAKKEQPSKQKSSNKEVKETSEPKKERTKAEPPISSAPKIILSDEDDLFTVPKAETKVSEKTEPEPAVEEKTKAEDETEVLPKAKKLPGAVSLFGGIDPFAARNNLKSPDKEKAKTTSVATPVTGPLADDDNDGLFGKKTEQKKEIPTGDNKTAAKKPASTKNEAPQKHVPVPKHDDAQMTKTDTPKKIKPTIAFNPATMLPGATPPVRNVEEPELSFDQPATVTTLHHANKDRARVQKKRRPPSRHFLQNAATTANGPSETPGTIPSLESPEDLFSKPVESRVTSAAKTQDSPVPNNIEKKAVKKPIGHADIFANDDDDFFSSKPFSPSNKSKDRAQHDAAVIDSSKTSDIFTPSKHDVTPSKPVVTPSKSDVSTSKKDISKSSDKTKKDSKDSDKVDVFSSDKKATDSIFDSDSTLSDTKKEKLTADNDSKKIVDDIFNPSTWKDKADNVKDDDDIFMGSENSKSAKTAVAKIVETNNEEPEDLFESSRADKKEKEATKAKKKEDKNMFNDDLDKDIFASEKTKKDEKKETTKKTKKSSRVVADDDLFGDTGSIFSDLPAKSKEKKKKKTSTGKDIFAKPDEDIFASGGEKKPKAKKKAEKTSKSKTTKTTASTDQNAPNIFDDPLNALGTD